MRISPDSQLYESTCILLDKIADISVRDEYLPNYWEEVLTICKTELIELTMDFSLNLTNNIADPKNQTAIIIASARIELLERLVSQLHNMQNSN